MKKKPPRRVIPVTRIIHRSPSLETLNEIAREIKRRERTGRNYEDREEYSDTWNKLFQKQTRTVCYRGRADLLGRANNTPAIV